MGNPFKVIDEIFEVFIQDGFGRAVLLHVPFWCLAYAFLWTASINLGPVVILYVVLIIGPIFLFSKIFYKKNTLVVVPMGIFLLLLIIGIPWVYSGLLLKVCTAKWFITLYSELIHYWWWGLNRVWPFKDQAPEKGQYDFTFFTIQWIYWVSGFFLPIAFLSWFNYREDNQVALEKRPMGAQTLSLTPEEIEFEANRKEARKMREQRILEEGQLHQPVSPDEAKLQEKMRLDQQRQAQEEEQKQLMEAEKKMVALEEEKQRRIKAITGKDPWDSGFL